ncbi:hypothetical protein [Ligaoa zhengdingensis]
MVGRQVTVTRGDESYPALVTGLSDSGGLLVRANDGRTLELTSGEVSIRM